jgi:hypothetical protein
MSPHLPGPALRELLMIITDHKMLCHSFAAPKNIMTHLTCTWDIALELTTLDQIVSDLFNLHREHLFEDENISWYTENSSTQIDSDI